MIWFKRIFTKGAKIYDPEGLGNSMKDNAYSKNYKKYKKRYLRDELNKEQPRLEKKKGRKIKHWKQIKCGSQAMYDEFIPIYHKKEKKYVYSRNGYKYYECKYKDIPKWVQKKWENIKNNNISFDIENKKFYFKGKKYRYIIETGLAMGMGGSSSAFVSAESYYKRKRGKK